MRGGATSAYAAGGEDPIAFLPIPLLHAHVGFPLDYTAHVNRICPRETGFSKVSGPPEFDIDGGGGLFYWTPTHTGTATITIAIDEKGGPGGGHATTTFQAVVDDDAIVYPLFRDYIAALNTVGILGRAYGDGFVDYRLEYADAATPADRTPITGPVGVPVSTTGPLGTWDISALPDGGRYILALTVDFADGTSSSIEDPIIIDRTAKPWWPKRVGPITHSPVLFDLDEDGVDEVLVVTHFGELYAWRMNGAEIFEIEADEATNGGLSVGDVDGDDLVDVAVAITDASYGGIVALWTMAGVNHDEHHEWPMLGHDPQHTGAWTPPRPDRPNGLQVTTVAGGTLLQWHDRSAVEDSYVAEQSATGTAWTWHAIATLPADTEQWTRTGTTPEHYRVRAARQDPRTGATILSRPSESVTPH